MSKYIRLIGFTLMATTVISFTPSSDKETFKAVIKDLTSSFTQILILDSFQKNLKPKRVAKRKKIKN